MVLSLLEIDDMVAKKKYRAAKIEDTIVMRASVIAEAMRVDGKSISVADVLSDILRGPIDREFAKALRRLEQHRAQSSNTG